MRALVANAIIVIFILIIMVHPVLATTVISIPFTSIGCAAFMEPLSSTACTIEEFNSASAFANSAESLDISFPLSEDNLLKGSAANNNVVLHDGIANVEHCTFWSRRSRVPCDQPGRN